MLCLDIPPPQKGLAISLILIIIMSGAKWQLASSKKFRIWKKNSLNLFCVLGDVDPRHGCTFKAFVVQ